MWRLIRRLILSSCIFLFCLSLWALQLDVRKPIQHVFIISVAGLPPGAYTQLDNHNVRVPVLRKFVQQGAYSTRVLPVFPTISYPAHTSIATGCYPASHGIVTNLAWDPQERNERGWRWYQEDIRVPTLWEVAHDRGMSTAL